MVNTKYGKLPDESLISYVEGLIGKVFKLIPMKQYNNPTLDVYLESLLRELVSSKALVEELKDNQEFLTLLSVIHSLTQQDNFKIYRSDALGAISTIKRIKSSICGDES